jgi:hypothetical protein
MSKEILVELHDLLKLATSGHACPHKHKEHLSNVIDKPDLWAALSHHCGQGWGQTGLGSSRVGVKPSKFI